MASITKKRKEELITKYNDWRNDSSNARGYTPDQQISIDTLRVQKLSHIHNANKSNLIALIGHEAAVSEQINAAERRDVSRCTKHNALEYLLKTS